jgi:ABC-2 type transport system permease protein
VVAQFLRLKLRLLGNSFRRSPWQIVGLILALAYGLGLAGLGVLLMFGLRLADADFARAVAVIGGSVIILGFAVVPLVFGVDDTLDPRRFSLFGIDNRRLSIGLLAAAAISVPSLALALIALSSVVTWFRDFGSVLLALISAVLILATGILTARVATSIAALLLATRRAKEWTALVALVALVLISPVGIVLAEVDWGVDGVATAAAIADTLAWTPFGAVWAFPGDAAMGEWGLALVHLLEAVAVVALLWLAWQRLVAHMLVAPERESRSKDYAGLGWFDRLPDNPGGAIAARSATYWLRDPRYRISLIMVPIVPFILLIPPLVVGVPVHVAALLPVPVFALMLGWAMHNDVAYENTAVWLHVASGTRGRADRLGRLFPSLVIGVPVVLVGSVVSAAFFGNWSVIAALIGVGLSLLFSGMGLSSITSARFPYPVVRPGDNAFSQPQNTGATLAVVQSFSFLASLLLSAPAVGFAVMGYFQGDDWYLWALLSGVVIGTLALVIGVAVGARVFDRRGPELLASALLNA